MLNILNLRNCWCAIILISATSSLYANPAWGSAAWDARPPVPSDLEALTLKPPATHNISIDESFSRGANEETFVSHGRPETEWLAWELAHLFKHTDDLKYAGLAESILLGLASREMPEPPQGIHFEGKWIPYPAMIAYGILNESGYWEKDATNHGDDNQRLLERWLREYKESFEKLIERPGQVTNYTPFGLKHAAVLGLILDDIHLLNLSYQIGYRLAFSDEFWHADIIWQEGTVSYARQVSGNLKAMIPVLQAGLPLGLMSYNQCDLDTLSDRLQNIDEAQARFNMPSGRPIPVNDTHWSIPSEAIPRVPRAIEFPDFGHFALPGSDIETHLSISPLTGGGRYGGGHYHDSLLSIQLWGHGQELLPDAGYPFRTANNRYFHMSPYAHSMAIVSTTGEDLSQPGNYGVWSGSWARSSILGYESGTASDNKINYILGSSLGPEGNSTTILERMLIQVSTGLWSGYVVDIIWAQGGDTHKSFLRQTEDEAVHQTISAPLVVAGETMAEVLDNSTEVEERNWSALLKNPKRVAIPESFQISWMGKDSGVELNAYLAPQEGSESWISEMPRLRPTKQNSEKRNNFPGYHLTRQRKVAADEITIWAAVYEPVQKGGQPKIEKVVWHKSGTGLTAEVTLNDRTDEWIVGRADIPTEINGRRLNGRAAGYSSSNEEIDWKWAALGSSLTVNDRLLISTPESIRLKVTELTETSSRHEITVDGKMTLPDSGWALLRFADGSGRAIELEAVKFSSSSQTQFLLKNNPGLTISPEGMLRSAFPAHFIPGATFLEPLGAFYEEQK